MSEVLAQGHHAAVPLPLPTLLSQTLVAFTIEFDNEFEHRMPHRTTSGPAADSRRGPWLVSQAMWSNFMQFVPPEGVPLRDLDTQARLTNLGGLERWGYVTVEPDPADDRPRAPRADWIVRPTRAGQRAQDVWRPLAGEIEDRWKARFGDHDMAELRESLEAVGRQLKASPVFYLPVLAYSNGMFTVVPLPGPDGWSSADGRAGGLSPRPDLSALLSRILLAFAIDCERGSEVSLAIGANTLRVLDEQGVRASDIPRLTGVSKEAVTASLGFLEKHRLVATGPDPTSPWARMVRLTRSGAKAQAASLRVSGDIEERWVAAYGPAELGALRRSLERWVGDGTRSGSPLSWGLEPYPDGWRTSVRPPDTLPHYPMVLHRGGFPDGS